MKILSAEFVISAAAAGQFPTDKKHQIAFAGRSNVGKSSLINSLLHRRNLAKVSTTPGKTQLINFFIINDSFYFVDLPGYGYARVPHAVSDAWSPLIEDYLKSAQQLAAVVVLFDNRRTLDERDKRLAEWLKQYDIPAIYALTKSDKLSNQKATQAFKNIAAELLIGDVLISTSAKSGNGIKELWKIIHTFLGDAE
jgi:GTP-binding protein